MRLVVPIEQRFDRTPDGAVWTPAQFRYEFWAPYLDVFETVRVVARRRDVATVPPDWHRASGEGVEIWPVPYFIGPWQYLRRVLSVRSAAQKAVGTNDAVLLRDDSQMAAAIEVVLRHRSQPYAMEVGTDPHDEFAPGVIPHPLRHVFRWLFTRRLRRQCFSAIGVAYVTEQALQRKYPCGGYSTSYSSIQLTDADFADAPHVRSDDNSPFTIVTVGSLDQPYKGVDVLLEALGICTGNGIEARVVVIGDGKYRAALETQATRLAVSNRVCFHGHIARREAIRKALDAADLFVLASRTEGLPRAMVEAMARGLPCIGTNVGGIPELLSAEALVPPNDPSTLATSIQRAAADPEWLNRNAAGNLETAKRYRREILAPRRTSFYQSLKCATQRWQRQQVATATVLDVVSQETGWNRERLATYARGLFDTVWLDNRSVLDIGSGRGEFSFYARSRGARQVVSLEPEFAGSEQSVTSCFSSLSSRLPLEQVDLVPITLQDFDAQGERFDVVLLHHVVNHLDEAACMVLRHSPRAVAAYHRIFQRLADVTASGGALLIVDASRYNIFGLLRMANPFAPDIEWHKHQKPELWAKLLRDAGFRNPRIRWLVPNRLHWARWILGNRVCAFFLSSHFLLVMERDPEDSLHE